MFPYIKKITILIILLIGYAKETSALNVSDFSFKHFTTQDGMLSQRVYSLCHTNDGALWWSTKSGVDRSNGINIQNYRLNDKALYSSFAGKTIKIAHTHTGFTKDGKPNASDINKLYVFDNNGSIFKYNPILDSFENIADAGALLNGNIVLNDVFVSDNCIWLAMREGIYALKDGRLTAVHKGVYATYIYEAKGNLYFCTAQGIYNKKQVLLKGIHIESAFYDSVYNKVWIGTFNQGIKIMDASLKNTVATLSSSVPHNPIRSITPYDHNTMLIGIDGFGVYQTHRRKPSDVKILFAANEGENFVLHGNGIYALLVDSWNNIVIGTYSGGIDIARPVGGTAAVFQHARNNMQTLINDHVNCVTQSSPEEVIMGTDDGVSIYNLRTRQWQHAARGLVVLDICKTTNGRIIIGTYGRGVCEIDNKGNIRELYSVANGSLKDDHVYDLLQDKNGNLWIGCLNGSLTVKTAEGFIYHDIDCVMSLTQFPDGRVGVGSADGLYLISPVTGRKEEIIYTNPKTKDANRYIIDVYTAKNDKLWIATDGGGIYIYDLKTKACQQLTMNDGLPSNYVSSITSDNTGRIWIATENGLCFTYPRKPNEVIDVNHGYGLKKEYTRNAVCNLMNGEILYGTVSGAVIINPKDIQRLNYTARLNLLGMSCSEKDSPQQLERFHDMLAKRHINLDYSQRTFEIRFESINLRHQFDIAYQYKLGDGNWSALSEMQYLRFENLEPGSYKLIMRSVSRSTGIVLDKKELSLTIAEPWWNSWWMWCIYVLLILSAFYGAWKVYDLHSRYMRLVVSNVNESEEPNADNSYEEAVNDTNNEFVDMATRIVLNNITDTEFTIDNLCQEMAMSRTLFYVKLKSYTGKSPQDFIRIIRLERAVALLRAGRNVSEVSTLVGFDNPKYFSTVFKKYFGVSPSKYR